MFWGDNCGLPEDDDYDEGGAQPHVTCRHCGLKGLHFKAVSNGAEWVLMANDAKHVCSEQDLYRFTSKDFD